MADPGLPRGGRQPCMGMPTYYLIKYSRKLHENEVILVRGGARPSRLPKSATGRLHGLKCASVQNDQTFLFIPGSTIAIAPAFSMCEQTLNIKLRFDQRHVT